MLWSAIGDSVGRRPLYLATLTIYLGACLGLSLCSTYSSVMALRALQAAGSASTTAIGAGLIGDLVHASRRGQFMGNYSALAGFATAFGPVLGGVFAQYTGWHGIFFFLLGLAASLLALVALLVPETMRSIVGDGSVAPPRYLRPPLLWLDAPKTPPTETQSLPRKPFKVDIVATLRLLMEPEVLCSVMFTGVCYTVWQMSMVATASLYSERYGLTELYIGLTYISNGTGSLCASVLTGKVLNLEYARQLAREKEQLGGHVREVQHIERARIRPMIIPTVLFIASVVAFGWVIEYHVHIVVSITLAFFVGGLDTCILATFSLKATLVVDLFQRQSFSVTACLNLSRCLVAAAGTAAIQPMIRAIGVGWAFTFSMFIVRNLSGAFPSIGTTPYTMASQTEKDTVKGAEEGLGVQNDPSDDIAKGETLKIAVDIVQAEHQYTDEQYAALLRKIDWWLLPLMWVCYGLTTVFYLSYLAFSFPGLIVLCIAFSTNFATIATLRCLQGLFECTISPAFLLITGSFYTAREHTMRAIIWGTANAGMGVLTELINYGIGRHAEAHAGGVAAWKGVSFFLGALTVVLSGLAFAVLGTPREVRWLSGEEKRMAVARVVRNQTGSDGQKRPEWKWDQVGFPRPADADECSGADLVLLGQGEDDV
ncbi:putative mfs multidrug protein [Neofusicoccum parvum UCRNP2]|uniref:Putative mfs multidrug protein n=1 Tax=Botryosphaeria parva (strain UCR-NP2) TaxID=1287680 RepID=R1G5P2_BOTPV|nr:putative mfs multidrug protein [Neofusicoccum parvum UCRNP2]